MSSPTKFYPLTARPYLHQPHRPAAATTEASRQPRARRRARQRRAERRAAARLAEGSLQ